MDTSGPGAGLPRRSHAAGEDGRGDDRLWPILITAGLALVILINALFIYIAVSGADDIVPSYRTEER